MVEEHGVWQERISAYLDGELGDAEEQALMEHLDECEQCRSAMLLLESVKGAMGEDMAEPPEALAQGARYLYEQDSKRRGLNLKRWRFTAIAAVICLALLGVVTLAPRLGNAARRSESVSAPAAMAAGGSSLMAVTGKSAGGTGADAAAEEAAMEDSASNQAPAAAEAPRQTYYASGSIQSGGAAPVPQATSAPETRDAGEGEGGGAVFGGVPEAWADNGVESSWATSDSLPGYAVYQELENPERYYSVCFVYGEVPQTIRTNSACVPQEAPEGQERWVVPLEVCLNEGLLEQFQEIYYGDLLSQQGLVIGILDLEEEKWLP